MFTLTGTLTNHAREPLANTRLIITPTPYRTVNDDGTVTRLGGKEITTDAEGKIEQELDTAPGLWYSIRSTAGGHLRPLRFEAPQEQGAVVDVSDPDLFPIPAPSPMAEYVRGASAYEVWLAQGNTGTVEDYHEFLRGRPGQDSTIPGPANTLTIGDVTTGDPGTEASVTITGDAPEQALSLVIPQGPAGDPTAFELRGTGNPNGAVAAPAGTYYTDTAGTGGAWRWLKKSAAGNAGWDVVHGDTGLRTAHDLLQNGWVRWGSFPFLIQRVQNRVYLFGVMDGTAKTSATFMVPPVGFRPLSTQYVPPIFDWNTRQAYPVTALSVGVRADAAVNGFYSVGAVTWVTADPWPTTLPGTPA